MTSADIIARLFSAKGLTADRVTKAKGMAARSGTDWLNVVIAMTPEQRKAVEDAKALEAKLKQEYPGNDHAVYGTLNAIGMMRGNKETAKGRAYDAKHSGLKASHASHPNASRLGKFLHPKKAR